MRVPTIGVVSLGCPKNATDAEVMLGMLNDAGFPVTFDNDKADMCLVNTCSFIDDARAESVKVLVELAGEGKEIIITGCLAQHFKEELMEELPEARAVVGTGDYHKIVDVVRSLARDSSLRIIEVSDVPNDHSQKVHPRIYTGMGAYGYLKIAEGCDHSCSFCIIPMLRGKFRSRTVESLVEEAQEMARAGVRELILVSQDSTYYGLDIYGRQALPELLRRLHEIDDIDWIRVMYFYPTEASEEILKTIASLPKCVKYVDIPLQHSHPEVLKKMARPLDPGRVVEKIRRIIPDVAVRSTFIVGFPGETEVQFADLLAFVKEMRFDRLGVFTYSRQLEVDSGHMPDQIPEKVKKQRAKRIMEVQHEIARKRNSALVGSTIEVLVEGYDESAGFYLGRSQWDAPDIDNQVYIKCAPESEIIIGDFVKVIVEEARAYDLYGSFLDEDAEPVNAEAPLQTVS